MSSSPRAVETRSRVHYNQAVSKAILALICAPLADGRLRARRSRPSPATPARSTRWIRWPGGRRSRGRPVDTTPLPGIDISKLGDKTEAFYKLVGSLQLAVRQGRTACARRSRQDTSCKRAPFAVRYVRRSSRTRRRRRRPARSTTNKYKPTGQTVKLDVSKAPHDRRRRRAGALRRVLRLRLPALRGVQADDGAGARRTSRARSSTYFMMFPLEQAPRLARRAAQAALAANAQGKFKEMHDVLFAKAPEHNHDARHRATPRSSASTWRSSRPTTTPPRAQVVADLKQGEAAGVDSHADPVLQRPQVRRAHASQVHRDVDRRRARGESLSRVGRPMTMRAVVLALAVPSLRSRPRRRAQGRRPPRRARHRGRCRGKPFKVKSIKGWRVLTFGAVVVQAVREGAARVGQARARLQGQGHVRRGRSRRRAPTTARRSTRSSRSRTCSARTSRPTSRRVAAKYGSRPHADHVARGSRRASSATSAAASRRATSTARSRR